ncbi:pyruvate dehydrogenase (acetyl-transferring) E1 component subunit alpha [Candidatus Endolissoclinum faulkneri]|nr:pyruvate dehydrogenase (acetyl-transferring) E1 component subunit alpha [Candidatus Endolissoclinum faulkneri]
MACAPSKKSSSSLMASEKEPVADEVSSLGYKLPLITVPSKEELIALYRNMLVIRRFEEKASQLYGMGLIGGFCHLYIGQEAVVVGMQASIEDGDTVVTSYRDHGHMLASGMEARGVMAELTGRIGGYSKGKGGSMHMFSREKNFFGGHGIVGAQVPIGTGLAFNHRYRKTDRVSLIYLGDGAVNQGQVYESFNMAALWKLPAIFIIENNEYAMGTSQQRSTAGLSMAQRGCAYGIPGEEIDGMDVLAVRAAGEKSVKYCRDGYGPCLLEMKTYRYRGHSMSDPAKYRSKDEVNDVRQKRDPIDSIRRLILKQSVCEDTLKKVDLEVKDLITEAANFSQQSPSPDIDELWTDVLI